MFPIPFRCAQPQVLLSNTMAAYVLVLAAVHAISHFLNKSFSHGYLWHLCPLLCLIRSEKPHERALATLSHQTRNTTTAYHRIPPNYHHQYQQIHCFHFYAVTHVYIHLRQPLYTLLARFISYYTLLFLCLCVYSSETHFPIRKP